MRRQGFASKERRRRDAQRAKERKAKADLAKKARWQALNEELEASDYWQQHLPHAGDCSCSRCTYDPWNDDYDLPPPPPTLAEDLADDDRKEVG